MHGVPVDPIVTNLTIFVLAIFLGYHVVWGVTPALHTPLMSVTNAISSVIIVGAIIAAAAGASGWGVGIGVLAVALASVNTFGGFLVTERMLDMFKKKEPERKSASRGAEKQ
jgi:NAD(P) transhydrogenase subunit alpha